MPENRIINGRIDFFIAWLFNWFIIDIFSLGYKISGNDGILFNWRPNIIPDIVDRKSQLLIAMASLYTAGFNYLRNYF